MMKEQTNKHDRRLSANAREFQITPEGIRHQLNCVLSNPDLMVSKKVKTIFRYLTDESVAGSEDRINAQKSADKANRRPLDPDF